MSQNENATTAKLSLTGMSQTESTPTVKLSLPRMSQNENAKTAKLSLPGMSQTASTSTVKLSLPGISQSESAKTAKLSLPGMHQSDNATTAKLSLTGMSQPNLGPRESKLPDKTAPFKELALEDRVYTSPADLKELNNLDATQCKPISSWRHYLSMYRIGDARGDAAKSYTDESDSSDDASDLRESRASMFSSVSFKTAFFRLWKREKNRSNRAILKNGMCNVLFINKREKGRRYMQDLFTTMVDWRWRYTLLTFGLSFFLSWLLFALLWYLIAYAHGDFIPPGTAGKYEGEKIKPCILNVHGFLGCFMYSVESQMTIGYGTTYPSKECPEAIFVLCMQSILGLILQAFMVGIVFAKLTRPQLRAQTLIFSHRAVVCLRDSKLCLMFRLADLRKSHIVDARLRAHLLRPRVSPEGEHLTVHRNELPLTIDNSGSYPFLIWPLTAVHVIDENSPLYYDSAEDLLKAKLEVLVFLEGIIESTGMMTQARSSYLSKEIFWGHRFLPMIRYDKKLQGYQVNHKLLDYTLPVDTPLCSARDLDEIRDDVNEWSATWGTLPAWISDSEVDVDDDEDDEDDDDIRNEMYTCSEV